MDVYAMYSKELGIELPEGLGAAALLYKPVNQTGNLLFISGQGSIENGTRLNRPPGRGRDGRAGSKSGREACAINTLKARSQAYLGDLNRI